MNDIDNAWKVVQKHLPHLNEAKCREIIDTIKRKAESNARRSPGIQEKELIT